MRNLLLGLVFVALAACGGSAGGAQTVSKAEIIAACKGVATIDNYLRFICESGNTHATFRCPRDPDDTAEKCTCIAAQFRCAADCGCAHQADQAASKSCSDACAAAAMR